MRGTSPRCLTVATVVALFFLAGCSHGNGVAHWSVVAVSGNGRTLLIAADVSCDAKVTSSHVHEYADRVAIGVDTRRPSGSCASSLLVREVKVRLAAALGIRWLDGACANGCPTEPARASLHCDLDRPFGFGFLPSGWQAAKNTPDGTVAAYQSADGTETIELSHSGTQDPRQASIGDDVYALGTSVPLETIPNGLAFTLHLAGRGPGCGAWRLVARGITQPDFTTIADQLFPL